MFVSFRKCSRPQKPDPISDHSCQNLYPFSDQNGSKTIPFEAAHTYIPSIGEYPPPPPYIICLGFDRLAAQVVGLSLFLLLVFCAAVTAVGERSQGPKAEF